MVEQQKESRNEELAGLNLGGRVLTGQELTEYRGFITAVAEKERAFGVKIKTDLCAHMCRSFEKQPGPDEISVVIGDPYLLEDVIVVARGDLRDLQAPEAIRTILNSDGYYDHYKSIVFKNMNGSLIWMKVIHTTTREDYERKLGRKLTESDLTA